MFLETRHLRSMKTIADSHSLVHAAKQLHLTQSALSHQIKALENYFNTSLFLRGCKPLQLTVTGQQLVKLANEVLPRIAQTEYELKRLANGEMGRLYITIECHACFEWLIGALDQYRKHWAEIEVDLRMGMSFDAIPALVRGEIDLVISSDPVQSSGILFEPLFPYEGRLAIAPDHPLAERDFITPKDLIHETLITYPVPRDKLDVFRCFLSPENIEPRQVRHVELTAMMLQLVASKRGVAVLPDWVLSESIHSGRLRSIPLGTKGLHGVLYAAIRQQDTAMPFVRDFIDLASHAVMQ